MALLALLAGPAAARDPPDVAITKVDSLDPVTNGATLNYTITVQNLGPAAPPTSSSTTTFRQAWCSIRPTLLQMDPRDSRGWRVGRHRHGLHRDAHRRGRTSHRPSVHRASGNIAQDVDEHGGGDRQQPGPRAGQQHRDRGYRCHPRADAGNVQPAKRGGANVQHRVRRSSVSQRCSSVSSACRRWCRSGGIALTNSLIPAGRHDWRICRPSAPDPIHGSGRLSVHAPMVEAEIGGISTLLVLDTGSDTHLLTAEFAAEAVGGRARRAGRIDHAGTTIERDGGDSLPHRRRERAPPRSRRSRPRRPFPAGALAASSARSSSIQRL